MSIVEALELADKLETNLVQVGENNGLAVCKLMDFQKFMYEKHKKEKKNLKQKIDTKEVRLSPMIADNDLKIKAKSAVKMLENGDYVKVTIQYRGRLLNMINDGAGRLMEFEKMIECPHYIKKEPKINGNRVDMLLIPNK